VSSSSAVLSRPLPIHPAGRTAASAHRLGHTGVAAGRAEAGFGGYGRRGSDHQGGHDPAPRILDLPASSLLIESTAPYQGAV
jgi:hypothetical protein